MTWLSGQTVISSTFVADAGPRVYSFKARLHSTINGGTTGVSPPASITAT